MTAPVLEVQLGGVLTTLSQAQRQAADLIPVWEGQVDGILREMFAETFATEGRSIGEPWAPLAALTLELKARAHRAQMGILRFEDTLFRSLTLRSDQNQLREVTPTSFRLGTRVPYAARHQEGWISSTIFGRPRARAVAVPARPLVPDALPPGVLTAIEEAVATYITTGAA